MIYCENVCWPTSANHKRFPTTRLAISIYSLFLCVSVRGWPEGEVSLSPHHPAADHGEGPGLGRPQLCGEVPGRPLQALWEDEGCPGWLPQGDWLLETNVCVLGPCYLWANWMGKQLDLMFVKTFLLLSKRHLPSVTAFRSVRPETYQTSWDRTQTFVLPFLSEWRGSEEMCSGVSYESSEGGAALSSPEDPRRGKIGQVSSDMKNLMCSSRALDRIPQRENITAL